MEPGTKEVIARTLLNSFITFFKRNVSLSSSVYVLSVSMSTGGVGNPLEHRLSEENVGEAVLEIGVLEEDFPHP